MGTLDKELSELELLVATLQETESLDTSIKTYEKAVKKANALLEHLSKVEVEIVEQKIKNPL